MSTEIKNSVEMKQESKVKTGEVDQPESTKTTTSASDKKVTDSKTEVKAEGVVRPKHMKVEMGEDPITGEFGVLSADPEYYQYWAQVDLDAEEREDEMMEYTNSELLESESENSDDANDDFGELAERKEAEYLRRMKIKYHDSPLCIRFEQLEHYFDEADRSMGRARTDELRGHVMEAHIARNQFMAWVAVQEKKERE